MDIWQLGRCDLEKKMSKDGDVHGDEEVNINKEWLSHFPSSNHVRSITCCGFNSISIALSECYSHPGSIFMSREHHSRPGSVVHVQRASFTSRERRSRPGSMDAERAANQSTSPSSSHTWAGQRAPDGQIWTMPRTIELNPAELHTRCYTCNLFIPYTKRKTHWRYAKHDKTHGQPDYNRMQVFTLFDPSRTYDIATSSIRPFNSESPSEQAAEDDIYPDADISMCKCRILICLRSSEQSR